MRPQLRFEPLRFGCAKIERLEKPVKADHVRKVVVKIGQPDGDPILPEPLFHANVPAQIVFRFQSEIVPENFVLTARRTKSCRHARMQCCVCPVDFITAGESISPNTAELIEVIEAPACNENQIFDGRQRSLQKSGDLLRVIAHEGRPE